MKKFLCLTIIIILFLTFVGCTTIEDRDIPDSSMFIRVECERLSGYVYSIVYHKETKVMYAVSYQGIFTVMVDADGDPLLWEEK
jgi:hypothetical protein